MRGSEILTAPPGARVLYVWDADYPWDVRVEKICDALQQYGFEVHIAARNRARRQLTEALPEGVVHRMPVWPHLPARLDALSGFPAFCNPRWIHHLKRTVARVQPGVIIVRDLPLAPAAIRVARQAAVPVILDMAENYPAMLRDLWSAGRQRPWDLLVRNPRLARMVERWSVARVDRVLVVVEESGERLQREYALDSERITLVSNTPPRGRATGETPIHSPGRPVQVVYLGIMEIPRGVLELLEAIAYLRSKGMRMQLRLIGGGRDLELFRTRARELGLAPDEVDIPGFVPDHGDALAMVGQSDIGVLPYRSSETWNTTIANKIFDYMAAGLAVITSDVRPCVRILRETGAGIVFRAGDVGALAAALSQLGNAQYRAQLGQNGRRAVLDRYNWESDAAELVRAVAATATTRYLAAPRAPSVENPLSSAAL